MRCKECGGTIFLCDAEFITEYHDAGVEFKGVLSGNKFEITPGTLRPSGSFYLCSVRFTCSKCGKEIKYDEAGVDCPEEVLEIIERYAGRFVFNGAKNL